MIISILVGTKNWRDPKFTKIRRLVYLALLLET